MDGYIFSKTLWTEIFFLSLFFIYLSWRRYKNDPTFNLLFVILPTESGLSFAHAWREWKLGPGSSHSRQTDHCCAYTTHAPCSRLHHAIAFWYSLQLWSLQWETVGSDWLAKTRFTSAQVRLFLLWLHGTFVNPRKLQGDLCWVGEGVAAAAEPLVGGSLSGALHLPPDRNATCGWPRPAPWERQRRHEGAGWQV